MRIAASCGEIEVRVLGHWNAGEQPNKGRVIAISQDPSDTPLHMSRGVNILSLFSVVAFCGDFSELALQSA